MEQYQFINLSQKQTLKINYLLEKANNNGTKFEFLNNFSDNHGEFNITFRGKKMLAIGSERAYRFITFLAENKITNQDEMYAKINKKMQDIFFENMVESDVIYNELYQQEFVVSRLLIALIDRYFFENTLRTWGWDDKIQIIWGSHTGGVSASTMRYGDHSIIKVNLYAFVSWISNLKIKDGKSIGNNDCSSIIDCIVKTVCHEIVHSFLQMTPCIIDTDKKEIIIRSKSIREHYQLSKIYKDVAYINRVPYFTFGQIEEGPGSSSLEGSGGGHRNTFMSILHNWFGQTIPQHNLYTINYQQYQKFKF